MGIAETVPAMRLFELRVGTFAVAFEARDSFDALEGAVALKSQLEAEHGFASIQWDVVEL